MTEIIPAIIPKSFFDLKDKLGLVAGLVSTAQVDILDGKLTPTTSWPYLKANDPDFLRIAKEEEGFPYWEELDFECDLMILNTEETVPLWISAGAKRIVVHYESFNSAHEVLDFVRNFTEKFGRGDSFFITELGVAINILTPNDFLKPLIPYIDFVQFMGIAEIGIQGAPFDGRVLDKIRALRNTAHNLPISVDGGVNLDSAPKLIGAGASRLVSGSAIFNSDNIADTIDELESIEPKV
jgi:ribulose-phosphate 3-epimerase